MANDTAVTDELRRDLAGAIERGELRLEFQPIVRLGSGAVMGAEALVRWRHPRRGTVAPADFLPIAEQSGLIDGIGAFVLEQAVRTAATWPRSADRPAFVSVNVVPSQLRASGIAQRILATLADAGLEPRLLTIELTSGVGGDAASVAATLAELREAGVRVALDDFGLATTLADLKRVPVDEIKLAREFVGAIHGPPEEADFALSLISLAGAHDADVVAKGVESREQAWRLAEAGCRYGQGFFFSKPLGASGLLAVLRQGSLRA